jgi:hypothetical protein
MRMECVQGLRRCLQVAGEWWRFRTEEFSRCRACERPINPLADVCEHCGAGNPVKIAAFPAVVITAVCCEICLLIWRLA